MDFLVEGLWDIEKGAFLVEGDVGGVVVWVVLYHKEWIGVKLG